MLFSAICVLYIFFKKIYSYRKKSLKQSEILFMRRLSFEPDFKHFKQTQRIMSVCKIFDILMNLVLKKSIITWRR